MSRLRPNLEPLSMDKSNKYSSIDDTPQPVNYEDSFFSNGLTKCSTQLFQQTMKFHFGTEVKPQPEVTSPLPDIVPTSSDEILENMSEHGIQEQTADQVVPDISTSVSYMLPDISPCNFEEFYGPNPLDNNLYHMVETNNHSNEWRSTKLPSDKSKAIDKALCCFLQCCSDDECKKGKRLIDELVKKIQHDNKVNCDDRQILEYLLNHQQECSEYFCIAPGCSQIEKYDNSLQGLIQCIKNFLSRQLQKYTEGATLHKFSSKCCLTNPQDVKEISTYTFTSKYSISSYSTDYGWSKITLLGEVMQDILPLLIKIGQLSKHRNILAIDWLIHDDIISFSSDLCIEPLACKLAYLQNNKWSFFITKKDIILQLIEAALYLNHNHIAFLSWTSENICWTKSGVKLTNFHKGSSLFNDFNPGIIKCLVFPTILPPELNLDITSLEKADVWGVGCLLYELLTYKVVHSDLLHMERHEIWKTLDETGWRPKCTFNDEHLCHFLSKAWEEKPNKRISLEDFRCEILNHKEDFEYNPNIMSWE